MTTLPVKKEVYMETSDVGYRVDGCEKAVVILTLYNNGTIRTCNQAGAALLGFSVKELVGQSITRLLPQLIETKLVESNRTNSYLRFLSRLDHPFEVVGKRDVRFANMIFFNDMKYLDQHYLRVIIRPVW
ncbi:PAS fold [Nitrosomonas sp. Nm51]|uniref:PAS domain-containing protein n=1 Tax=Nitrosomonas sp. Nm51 TaxID=133720 RepID=UPI0008C4FC8A|nr:PAS domain-containing protein [Nitrosomonas sp. Nm51]SER58117.1 PAS fold [Nitrosomonas sp. Nm51]